MLAVVFSKWPCAYDVVAGTNVSRSTAGQGWELLLSVTPTLQAAVFGQAHHFERQHALGTHERHPLHRPKPKHVRFHKVCCFTMYWPVLWFAVLTCGELSFPKRTAGQHVV